MSQLKNILSIPKASSPLPPGIEILPYCYFKQGGINTGIIVSSTFTKIEMKYSYNNTSNGYWCWGSRTSSSSSDRFTGQDATSGVAVIVKTTNKTLTATDKKEAMELSYDGSSFTLTNEGVTSTQTYSGFPNGTYPFYFGRANNGGTYTGTGLVGYFYYLRFYDAGTLIGEFLPAKDTLNNDAVGLYNTVNRNMYYPIIGTIQEEP